MKKETKNFGTHGSLISRAVTVQASPTDSWLVTFAEMMMKYFKSILKSDDYMNKREDNN